MKLWHKIAIILFAIAVLALAIYLIYLEQELLALVIMGFGIMGLL